MRKVISLVSALLVLIMGSTYANDTANMVKKEIQKDYEPATDGDKCIGTSGTH